MPVIWIVRGEFNCTLTMEAPPDAFPVAVGVKLAVNVKLFPGSKFNGREAPLMLKPTPVIVVWEMVMGALPEFVTLKL